MASTDGRSFTGHDRRAALRRLGLPRGAQPCSWELALRLQLGAIARSGLGRGIRLLLSFMMGALSNRGAGVAPGPAEEQLLGLQGIAIAAAPTAALLCCAGASWKLRRGAEPVMRPLARAAARGCCVGAAVGAGRAGLCAVGTSLQALAAAAAG